MPGRRKYLQILWSIFVSGLLLIPTGSFAADSAQDADNIQMTGNGVVMAMPDQAEVTAEAVSQAPTAGAAVAANAVIMNRAIAKLKELGAPEKSIIVNGFQLEPQYLPEDPKKPRPPTLVGYEVANSVSVKLDDISRAGVILDGLLDAGVNRGVSVTFSIKNTQPLLDEARARAAADALKRAQIYAGAVGVTLGPVHSIREGYGISGRSYGGGDIQSVPIAITALSREATPVSAGEQTVSATVTILWGIK